MNWCTGEPSPTQQVEDVDTVPTMALESMNKASTFIPFEPSSLRNLGEETLEVLRLGLEESTRKKYFGYVKAYLLSCATHHEDPHSPHALVHWLGEVRREQPTLRYEAYKSRRSAISTYFSLVPGADRMGEHPLVTAYMRGIAKVAPSDLALHAVQDIDLSATDRVLRVWAGKEKKGRLSYEKKAARAAFLMYLTGMRGCDQQRIKLSACKIPADVRMPVDLKMSWTKESKLLLKGSIWQKIVGVAQPLDHWCPVRAIHSLADARPRTEGIADTLLVAPDGQPYSRNAITRIIRILLVEAGMPANTRVHTIRLVGATTALEAAIPEALVRKAFRFSLTSDTLDRHYNRPTAAVAQAVAEAASRHRVASPPPSGEEAESRPAKAAPKQGAPAVRAKVIRAKGKHLPRGRKRVS
jgi:hypothetical protein